MAPPPVDEQQESRRDRLRRELTQEVIHAARQQLENGGRAGVSWRGLAREVGMNPASLYTYFDSLDDVFTAVILESFRRLGTTLQAAHASTEGQLPTERLNTNAQAFRHWAVAHPAEFNLIFTDQIPGYAAPPGGPTVEAQRAIFGPFAESVAALMGKEAVDSASLALPPPESLTVWISLWSLMHGMVMLEINHHLPFVEDHEALFTTSLERAVQALI